MYLCYDNFLEKKEISTLELKKYFIQGFSCIISYNLSRWTIQKNPFSLKKSWTLESLNHSSCFYLLFKYFFAVYVLMKSWWNFTLDAEWPTYSICPETFWANYFRKKQQSYKTSYLTLSKQTTLKQTLRFS